MIWSGGTCHRWRRTCQHTLTSVATSSSETLVLTSSIICCGDISTYWLVVHKFLLPGEYTSLAPLSIHNPSLDFDT